MVSRLTPGLISYVVCLHVLFYYGIAGRPFPLKGRYVANIFIHFEPSGRPVGRKNDATYFDTVDFSLPPYLIRGSPEQSNWESENPNGWKMVRINKMISCDKLLVD
jgi:hypothetical protein